MKTKLLLLFLGLLLVFTVQSQNPIIRNQFSADPTARVFKGKVYLYPSHDIRTPAEKTGRKDWFCMEDYHVFSSENLTDWTDHGVLINQKQVPWVDASSYSMWAPDCIEKGGRYYFYFPATARQDSSRRGGFGVGVGIANNPEGPFVFEKEPIAGLQGIDPCVLIDPKDGQAYIYWAMGRIRYAKLTPDLLHLASEPKTIEGLPDGFKEGPFVFERRGKYYLTYPLVIKKTEALAYSVSDSPGGPFVYGGVIMDESPVGCWTNHHSLVEYQGAWYLFYHNNAYSPAFDKNRSVCVDKLFFEPDGSIQKVQPTLRGAGITQAGSHIQIDRYSAAATEGISLAFVDTSAVFDGWKIQYNQPGAFSEYADIEVSQAGLSHLRIRYKSVSGAALNFTMKNLTETQRAESKLSPSASWQEIIVPVPSLKKGLYNLRTELLRGGCEIDWIKFE